MKKEGGEDSTPTLRRDGLGTPSPAESAEPTRTLGAPPAWEVRFPTDDVLAGRYQIVRFLAQGGMGEVYEATDLELGDRVALKAIRPDIAQDAEAMERFRREIQLSRKVTHPNVCRVFDVCHHEKEGTTATFLTMEFLSGETLGHRMRARARLPVDEALPIVEQIAVGLDAAHRAGIVHRDFKPDNVILTESDAGPRAVVTDFGLARRSSLTGDTVTGTGAILGTPAYMAPEQLEGGPITAATDVYALGCVLYEMVTGVRPFQGDTPMITAVQRLKETPVPPRRRFKELSPVWNDVILRCLERDPGKRFAGTKDVVAALTARPAASRSKAKGLAALAVAAVIGVGVGAVTLTKSRSEPAGSPEVSDREVRRSVAILGFKNLSGREESAWLSTALSEMLGTELAAGEELRIVSGENVARVKQDLSLPASDTFARDTLARIRAQLGCDLVMLGSYTALPGGGQVRLDMRLQDARAGQTVMSLAASGMEAELFDLVSSIGTQIREKVGLRGRSDAEAVAVRASLPMSVEAARLFSEGLDKLRGYEYASARDVLKDAVEIEPDFALSHWALAEAWWELGYRARAQEQAGRAVELSEGLSREERLKIEGRQAAFSDNKKDRERAVELYRTLWSFFPDELDYGLALAEAQEPKPALETLAGLKQMSSPSSSDIRIDLLEAKQGIELSDYQTASSAARRAVEKAERSGSRVLLAWALSAEARTLQYGDDADAPLESVKRAQEIYAALGDRRGVAEAMLDEAHLLRRKDTGAARSRFRESLRLLRDMEAEPQVARALDTFAELSMRDGHASEAERMRLEALEIFRRIGSQRDVAYQLLSLGQQRRFQGYLAGARSYFRESADVLLALDDVDEATREPLFWLATTDVEQGDLENAKSLFLQVLDVDRRLGIHSATGGDHLSLGDIFSEQGRIDEALGHYREALRLLSLVPDHWGMVVAHEKISALLVLKAELQAARNELREAAGVARAIAEPVLEARILVREAAVVRGLGDVDSATTVVSQAMELARPDLLGRKHDIGFQLGVNLGTYGALDDAMFVHRLQFERGGQRGSKIEAGWHGQEIAALLRAKGQLQESDSLYRELASGFEEAGSRGDLLDTLTAWGNVQTDRGQLEAAERSYRRTLQIAEEVGNRRRAGYARLDLANLSVERGTHGQAASLRSTAAAYREQQEVYGECYAQYVLARASMSEGESERAIEALDRALALSALLPDHNPSWIEWHQGRELKGWVALEAARIRKDIEALKALRGEAERIGRVGNAFAARLVLAEISPPSESRRQALQELEREAHAKGFLHIARKAAALLS